MCCLCIILNVTYYRNGAQGGRIRGRVIRSGAAPSRPDTRQGARSLPGSLRTANLDLLLGRGRELCRSHPRLHLPPTPVHSSCNIQILARVDWIQRRCWKKAFLFFGNHPPTPLFKRAFGVRVREGGSTMERTNLELELHFSCV